MYSSTAAAAAAVSCSSTRGFGRTNKLTYLVQSPLRREDRDLVVIVRVPRHGGAATASVPFFRPSYVRCLPPLCLAEEASLSKRQHKIAISHVHQPPCNRSNQVFAASLLRPGSCVVQWWRCLSSSLEIGSKGARWNHPPFIFFYPLPPPCARTRTPLTSLFSSTTNSTSCSLASSP